jgi:glycosyltransferase involved in cell wall biosynthesis
LPRLIGRRPGLRVLSFQFNARQLEEEHRLFAPYIDTIIAESFDAAAALTAGGAVQAPIAVISSGVPVAALAARPRPPAGNALTVGYVGRFDRTKNPRGFLRIAQLLRRREYLFVMAGPAPAHFRAPRRIEFHGLLLGETLQRLVDEIDVLVVPSRNDGRPLIIQEAQARGIAVVAAEVGGIPELVENDVTGLLCPVGDYAAFAKAVDRLAADPALRQRLGAAGRARVQREGDVAVALPLYAAAILGASPIGRIAA